MYTNTNVGKIFSFFEIHKPICGTIDLFSNRAKSKIYREFWQQIKVIILIIIFVCFSFVVGVNFLTLIFCIYLLIFFNSGRFAVMVARGEDLTYKIKFLNFVNIYRYFKLAFFHKRELILIIVTCISSISYATFYFSFDGKLAPILLRYLDLLGFSFSFFYSKYLLRGIHIPKIAMIIYILLAFLLSIITFYLVNFELSLFFLLRLLTGYICVLFLYLKQETTISIISFITSMSYWSYHLYGDIFSLKLVLVVEIICLLGFVIIYFKKRSSL